MLSHCAFFMPILSLLKNKSPGLYSGGLFEECNNGTPAFSSLGVHFPSGLLSAFSAIGFI